MSFQKYSEDFRDTFVREFKKNRCQVTKTAKQFSMNPNKILEWRKEYPDFNEKLEEAQKELNEAVEETLVDQALDPRGQIVPKIFYLKNNWPQKYADRQVHELEASELWFNRKKMEVKVIEPEQLVGGTGKALEPDL